MSDYAKTWFYVVAGAFLCMAIIWLTEVVEIWKQRALMEVNNEFIEVCLYQDYKYKDCLDSLGLLRQKVKEI